MKLKRFFALLLCGALLCGVSPVIPAAAAEREDPMDNYVVFQIHDRKQFTPLANGYGSAWKRDLQIDLKGIAPENLALQLRFYFEDSDDPQNVNLLTARSRDLKLATSIDGGKNLIWKADELRTVTGDALKPGVWNDILLPFSTGQGYANFDFSKDLLTFFWFEFGGMSDPGHYTVRLADVGVVDTSRPAEKPEETVWDTTYEVADIPYALDRTFSPSEASSMMYSKTFEPIDASAHDPKKLHLKFTAEAENLTHPGNLTLFTQATGQLELTSGGACDKQELSVNVGTLNWQSGVNEYDLPLSSFNASSVAGSPPFNPASINYMRIYMVSLPTSNTDVYRLKIYNVRLVDATDSAVLPTLFSDGMLFQQNKPMKLWGYAKEGDQITGVLKKGAAVLETLTAAAGSDGRWELAFSPRKGGYDRYTLQLSQGDVPFATLKDLLVGELWLASGQSNMELSVNTDLDSAAILADAKDPYLRIYLEPTYPAGNTGEQPLDPTPNVEGAYWVDGTNASGVSRASAVAYHFAKRLRKELDLPVGILNASVGGSVIEAWLPRTAVLGDDPVRAELIRRGLYYDEGWWSSSAGTMSTLYNQKVGPLAGFNIAGTIWYQGESNSNRAEIYDIELDLLKRSWGEAFGFPEGDMPLIYCQVAPWRYDNGSNNRQHLGWLAVSMEKAWEMSKEKNTAMLPIYDLPLDHMKDGVSSDPIHPRVKTPVGERFALAALNMVYGGEGEYTAPVYKKMRASADAVYITFDRVGEGLITTDGSKTVHGFVIAGNDRVYVPAQAEIIDEKTVKVWNNRVKDPKNVMYAFDNFNQGANLANSVGIPASPFRTAVFTDTTMQPAPNVRYFTAQDWMYCDKDVWVYDPANTEERNAGVRPSFKVTGGEYTYDTAVKAEGTASLKVHGGSFTLTPLIYAGQQQDWSRFKYLTVWVYAPAGGALAVKANGAALSLAQGGTAAQITDPDSFVPVTFDLSGAANLKDDPTLELTFTQEGEADVYFDGFSLGLTDPITPESELAPVPVGDEAALTAAVARAKGVEKGENPSAEYTAAYDALQTALQAAEGAEGPVARARALADLEKALEREAALRDAAPRALKGDADGDGKITSTDARLTLQLSVNKINGSEVADPAALDIDGDGKVTSTDARLVLQYAVGKLKDWP